MYISVPGPLFTSRWPQIKSCYLWNGAKWIPTNWLQGKVFSQFCTID